MKNTVYRFAFVGLIFVVAFAVWGSRSYGQTNADANTKFERVVRPQRIDFLPYDLRVEYLKAPVGIDVEKPRFSWKIQSRTNGETQTAYQIELLAEGSKEPVWNSEKTESGKMVAIEYAGPDLKPGTVYFWNLTTWNKDGKESSTVQSRFSTGVDQWGGKWIGLDDDASFDQIVDFNGAKWIWTEKVDSAPIGRASFRKIFELPNDPIAKAQLAFTADNSYKLYLNGKEISSGTNFNSAALLDCSHELHAGKNVFAVEVQNFGDAPNPAGLLGTLKVVFENGKEFVLKTDASWKCADDVSVHFQDATFNDSGWKDAAELVDYGGGPWNQITINVPRKSLPARYLRKDFTPDRSQIVRATAYISGLGYYELYLNGHKIGDHVLDPVLTDYDKQVPYVTYEIDPRRYRPQENTIGVILGNGRYYAPRTTDPTTTRTFGYPKLMFQMVLEYRDGSKQTIVSDESWKITTNGPIRENCDYDGEVYDARKEIPLWGDPRMPQSQIDAEFKPVQIVEAPKGRLVAQMMPPMRKTEELRPLSVKQVKPGVWVYDFGQNVVGWCRLNVRGPAGTQITLRHAETLQLEGPDKGMLYVANLRNAKCRDIYTLKGGVNETYEPRFSYHGFRYAEITGFPGRPNPGTLTAFAVSTDLPIVGKFECSNPLINRIYKCIEWGVRDNYLSIPTDCPQRDERQGWQGDRAGESLGEMYMFDNYTLYAKWMKDVQDSQLDDGNLSDVCPNFWPLYSSNVTWPSAFTIIPGSLYKMYGDERPIARHYEAMKKWMDHLTQFVREDGTIDKDNYGDWCVPPEKPELIHSQDPARKTTPGILATSYYIHNLNLLAQYGDMLGKADEAKGFRDRAAAMTEAFNKRFYNAEKGQYDNGTQTSCVLPLAFGLVPKENENKVFATLTNNIANITHNHIGTGLIGGQWLNMILAAFDRNDIAYTFVSNKDYPSWGYMVENGATTVWELWNGNTADPAMNSGNHVMLVGDLVIWMYRVVAGIPAIDSAKNGELIFSPHPGGGLTFAKAEYDSAYGMIKASWRLSGGKMYYDVTIPVGQKGKIILPTANVDSVKEIRGRAIDKKAHTVEYFNGEKKDRVLVEVPSGAYSFVCEYK